MARSTVVETHAAPIIPGVDLDQRQPHRNRSSRRRIRLDGPSAHARLPRVLHHFPELPVVPRWWRSPMRYPAAPRRPPPSSASRRRAGTGATSPPTRAIDAVSITAPELPAPRDRRRDGAGRQAHLDREAGRADSPMTRRRWPTRSRRQACRARSGSTTATHRPLHGPASDRDGEIGTITHARFRFFSDYAAHPEGALSWRYERDAAAAACSAISPRTASTWSGTCSATSTHSSPTPRSSSPSAPARRVPPAGMRARRAANWARWRTTTSSAAAFASPAHGSRWTRVAWPSASRTTTGSRSTAPGARCSGTSAG